LRKYWIMVGPTLHDVATAAGVSITTASRVLANRGDFSLDTRARVLQAATEIGYERTRTRRGRPAVVDARAIEFVCGLFGDYWADETTAGARHAALRSGVDLVMTMERNRPEDDWPVRVSTRRSSGVVLAIITPTSAQIDRLRSINMPLALLEPPSEPPAGVSSVSADIWQGGYDAAVHLVERGYERFALVRGEPRLRFGRARDEGFRAGLRERAGVEELVTADGDWNGTISRNAIPDSLFADPRRLGVFAYNDALALSFAHAAKSAGARIPTDVGIVGVDGDIRGAASEPSLTTVRQPLREMAMRAVEIVLAHREHPLMEPVQEVLPTELLLRGSTGDR
jgi:LacI family transcriptional regulator